MNIIKRIFKIGQAETHAALDKIEDPVKMTEQGIRDLKQDLRKAIEALAQVKAMEIKATKEYQSLSEKASNYQAKAEQLLVNADQGKLDKEEAERIAMQAIQRKEQLEGQARKALEQKNQFNQSLVSLSSKVDELKAAIEHWEIEYKELKAKAHVSKATKQVNRQLSGIDSSSTSAMLERMREKVSSDEAVAASYAEISGLNTSLDDKINSHLTADKEVALQSSLAEMKEKLGIK